MHAIRTLCLSTPLLLAAAAASQEIIYYKFDDNGGKRVVNYAAPTSPAPEEGTINTTDTNPWISPGKFGIAALRGGGPGVYSNVNTGWNGALSTSFSVAWFMRQRNAPPSTSYFLGAGASFRAFTGGVASTGIWLRDWGGAPADLQLATNIQALAAANWVHVSLVVDTTAGFATWYVDGVAQTPIPITGSVSVVPGANNFLVNANSPTTSSYYDIDEFRFHGNAVSAAIVLRWATVNGAADSIFGKGCNGKLDSGGAKPAVGNIAYGLNLTGPANAGVALAIGSNRLKLGAVPLPLDLGPFVPSLAGCNWESSSELWLSGYTDPSGNATFGLPLPADPSLNGVALFTQAFLAGSTYATSNPFAISIGL